MNILIIEDVKIAQKIAQIIFNDLGCKVDIASNGHDALNLFFENEYDLILMDIGLPDISGPGLTKKIRNQQEKDSNIPIVALSTNYEQAFIDHCISIGFNEFLCKPLTKTKSLRLLKTYGPIEMH